MMAHENYFPYGPPYLTLRVELDFCFVFSRRIRERCVEWTRINPDPPTAVNVIQILLSHAGVVLDNDVDFWPDRGWQVRGSTAELTQREVQVIEHRRYKVAGIKLISRAYDMSTDLFESDLMGMFGKLRIIEDRIGARFISNQDTGMQVTVGVRDVPGPARRTGFGIQTCKRVLQVVAAHERNVDRMLGSDRLLGQHGYTDRSRNVPLSHYLTRDCRFLEVRGPECIGPYTIFSGLAALEWPYTFDRLGDSLEVRDRDAVRVTTLINCACTLARDRYHNLDYREIQFRQAGSTLDPVEITAWMHFVQQVVRFADTASSTRIVDIALAGANPSNNGSWDLTNFLRMIDLDEEFVAFYRRDGHIGTGTGILTDIARRRIPRRLALWGDGVEQELDDLIEVNRWEQRRQYDPREVDRLIRDKGDHDVYGTRAAQQAFNVPHDRLGGALAQRYNRLHREYIEFLHRYAINRTWPRPA